MPMKHIPSLHALLAALCLAAPVTGWSSPGGHDDLRIQSPHVDTKAVRARYLKLNILKGVPGLWEFKVY